MVAGTSDPRLDFVLNQIETMVASEGGSIEVASYDDGFLKLKYTPGVNEECPECVPTHQQVRHFLAASLKVHAPYVEDVEVV
jgi:Fe-S cluster biogenesis protein NfuA